MNPLAHIAASVLGLYLGFRTSVWIGRQMNRLDWWMWNKFGRPGDPPRESVAVRIDAWLRRSQ